MALGSIKINYSVAQGIIRLIYSLNKIWDTHVNTHMHAAHLILPFHYRKDILFTLKYSAETNWLQFLALASETKFLKSMYTVQIQAIHGYKATKAPPAQLLPKETSDIQEHSCPPFTTTCQ